MPSEIIQIPKLTLEVTGNAKNNFEDLKANIKAQVDKEIKKIINTPESKSSGAVFLSTAKSKEEAFIYFLEKGIIPWWETGDNPIVYNEKELIELTKNQNFKTLFKSVLHFFTKWYQNEKDPKTAKTVLVLYENCDLWTKST